MMTRKDFIGNALAALGFGALVPQGAKLEVGWMAQGTKATKGTEGTVLDGKVADGASVHEVPSSRLSMSELPSGKALTVAVRPLTSLATRGKAIATEFKT